MRSQENFQPLVIHNPNSTNSVLTDDVVELITQDPRWGRPEIIETKYSDAMDNAKYIAESIKDDDDERQRAVWVCGGDGLSMAAANMVTVDPSLRESVLLMPLPVGNACDASRSLYGHNVLRKAAFLDVMSDGEDYSMNCIETIVNGAGRLGVAYAGFHCTAEMSDLYASDTWRNGRPDVPLWPPFFKRFVNNRLADIRDAGAMVSVFRHNQPFEYEEEVELDDGPILQATFDTHDILYNNVPVYAKLGRIAVNVRGGSVMMEFPAGAFHKQVISTTIQMLTTGVPAMPSVERHIKIVSEDVKMHVDGEPIALKKFDEVCVRDKPDAIRVALSTKRHPPLN
jgi:hypothetical protein